MNNKYLVKIATEEKKRSNLGLAAEGALGLHVASKAPEGLLGYHNIYHGTSKGNAGSIMQHGLDPSKGGSGAAGHSGLGSYEETSQGKVHVSKSHGTGKFFAGYTDHGDTHVKPPKSTIGTEMHESIRRDRAVHDHHVSSMKAGFKNMLNPLSNKGEVLKARVSDKEWQGFKPDPDMAGGFTTDKHIGTEKIVGHADHKGIGQFFSGKHLKETYSNKHGLKGAGGGLALAAIGAGLVGHAIHGKMEMQKKANVYLEKIAESNYRLSGLEERALHDETKWNPATVGGLALSAANMGHLIRMSFKGEPSSGAFLAHNLVSAALTGGSLALGNKYYRQPLRESMQNSAEKRKELVEKYLANGGSEKAKWYHSGRLAD